MRVAEILSVGSEVGGAERVVRSVADGLRSRGHEVRVVASDLTSPAPWFATDTVPAIDAPGRPHAIRAASHLWSHRVYRALRRLRADWQPDVVHFHTMGQLSPSAMWAMRGVPAALTAHAPEAFLRELLPWWLPPATTRGHLRRRVRLLTVRAEEGAYRLTFQRCVDTLVAPSRFMQALLERAAFGLPVVHIPNGIDVDAFPAAPAVGTGNILFAGRLDHLKGIDVLFGAIRILHSRGIPCQLTVVGDGPERQRLETLAAQPDLAAIVRFLGHLSGRPLADAYASAVCVAVPSTVPESFGLVVAEALASGRPVVASNTGGLAELVEPGVTGFLPPPGDPEALAAALVGGIRLGSLPTTPATCRERAEALDVRHTVDATERLYRELVSASRARP